MSKEMLYKLTLKSGKTAAVREMKIRDFNLASEIAGKAGNPTAVSVALGNEVMKAIIVSVDGKVLKPSEKESLDDILTVAEFAQMRMFVEDMLGNAEKPQVEMIPAG